MFWYFLTCKNNTKNVDPKKYDACSSKKSSFIEEQEASRLLRSLGIKKPLSNITLLGKILF